MVGSWILIDFFYPSIIIGLKNYPNHPIDTRMDALKNGVEL